MSKIRASTGMGRLVNACIRNGLNRKQVLAILKQVYPHRHTNRHNVDWYYMTEARKLHYQRVFKEDQCRV